MRWMKKKWAILEIALILEPFLKIRDAQNEKTNSTKQKEEGAVGGKTTKIHAIVDGLGKSLYLQLSAGNVHDSKDATDLLDYVDIIRQ